MRRSWNLPVIEFRPFNEIKEDRSVCAVTTQAAWAAVSGKLPFTPTARMEVTEANQSVWDGIVSQVRGDVIYAVGGGLAVDAAKYLSVQTGLPIVSLPTALSVDAFFTWASGVRVGGCVRYLETRPPDRVVIDFEVLGTAPAPIRAAGLCDVLSIATGLWDWKYAEERGLNPEGARFLPWAEPIAVGLLDAALECAESAGRGEEEGLKVLLDALALEVQLCNLIGHSRPEEGSEHYFAYSVENAMGKGLPHGDLVCPGIVLISRIQGQDSGRLERALLAGGVPLGSIPPDVVETTLRGLPAYCREHGLPHGIAHDFVHPG